MHRWRNKNQRHAESCADSDESVKGSGHMTATAGGRTMNSDVSFTSKWLGASCGDVK
ncbi:MAG: hypothetical protein DMG97_25910 [Acidobacteria bacterium]|nr:MAG: hypothetical protein DMG98_15200 [Acidobacteriota bacterium]PYV66562.1 MAG: hypothetical protein DMG96_42000 [Acidobacteriota bacterium]PYV68009.1 MAG: hypothetical protein DMG97_25910 [Acidobacteriota bacterium]